MGDELAATKNGWLQLLHAFSEAEMLPLPPTKEFKPKMGLPKLTRYNRVVSDSGYWSCWPKNVSKSGRSAINGERLKEMAMEAGYRDSVTLNKVVTDLTEGARIGCRGSYRDASFSTNAAMAYEDGEKVSDAVAEWVGDGYARGPTEKKDVPR